MEAFLLVDEQSEVVGIINVVKVCWPTWTPTLRLTCSIMKSIARQNRAGAKTHPCLTPEVVMNAVERRPARRTLADVAVCRSMIRSVHEYGRNTDTTHGLPVRFCHLRYVLYEVLHEKSIGTKMNDLDLRLEVVSMSCQPLRDIRR